MMMMKRQREESSSEIIDHDITSMANSLIMLSSSGQTNRVFECKTCNRQFQSFQALGGHRASHKKPKLVGPTGDEQRLASPPKPKTHECAICGLEFAIGQALGGHMRRHRSAVAVVGGERKSKSPPPSSPVFVLSSSHAPVVKKSNSRRVLCLDLNLTPSENSFVFGNVAPPAVHCFF